MTIPGITDCAIRIKEKGIKDALHKTLRCLSLFSGIGGIDYGLQCASMEIVGQVEIDPFCQKVLAKHWPDVWRFDDITKLTADAVRLNCGRIDLIAGGFPCFAKGTMIETEKGLRPIESIRVGEKVRTHTGKYQKVLGTMETDDKAILQVVASGLPPTDTTDEHPFYAREKRRIWNNAVRRYQIKFTEPEWVKAKDLTTCHMVAQRFDLLKDGVFSEELWYLVGRWLGDGWIVNHKRTSKIPQGQRGSRVNSRVWKAIICCSFKEETELAERIAQAGFVATMAKDRTTIKFHISSKKLVQFLQPFGKLAAGKQIPEFVFRLPISHQRAVWDGWVDSDGHRFDDGKIRGTTISSQLAYGIARLARNVNHLPAAIYASTPKPKTQIEGRIVNQRPSFEVAQSLTTRKGYVDEHFCWIPVRSIRRTGRVERVYNLEVEHDNTYIANSLVVHNCTGISVAGKGDGLADDRSALWFHMERLIAAIRPSWLFIENVPRLRTLGADRVLSDLEASGYTCWPSVVGAWAVGAPHKRDRVWIVARHNSVGRRLEYQQSSSNGAGSRTQLGRRCGDVANGNGVRESQPQGSIGEQQRRTEYGGQERMADTDGIRTRPIAESLSPRESESATGNRMGNSASIGKRESSDEPESLAISRQTRNESGGTGELEYSNIAGSQSSRPTRTGDSRTVSGESDGVADNGSAASKSGDNLEYATVSGLERERERLSPIGRSRHQGERDAAASESGLRLRPEFSFDSPGISDGTLSKLPSDNQRTGDIPLRWPARPGEQQYDWEHPRLVARNAQFPVGDAIAGLSRRVARHRRDSLKALGNAVVPAVVEIFGRAIIELENQIAKEH